MKVENPVSEKIDLRQKKYNGADHFFTCGGFGYYPNEQGLSYQYCGAGGRDLWEGRGSPQACPICGAPRDRAGDVVSVARDVLTRKAGLGDLRRAVRALDKEAKMKTEELIWEGPGWYASRQEWGRIRTFKTRPEGEEGLGTPFYLDEPFGELVEEKGEVAFYLEENYFAK